MDTNQLIVLQDALEDMRKSMKVRMEYEGLQAVLIKSKFDALIEQGFTETQAIELCKEL